MVPLKARLEKHPYMFEYGLDGQWPYFQVHTIPVFQGGYMVGGSQLVILGNQFGVNVYDPMLPSRIWSLAVDTELKKEGALRLSAKDILKFAHAFGFDLTLAAVIEAVEDV